MHAYKNDTQVYYWLSQVRKWNGRSERLRDSGSEYWTFSLVFGSHSVKIHFIFFNWNQLVFFFHVHHIQNQQFTLLFFYWKKFDSDIKMTSQDMTKSKSNRKDSYLVYYLLVRTRFCRERHRWDRRRSWGQAPATSERCRSRGPRRSCWSQGRRTTRTWKQNFVSKRVQIVMQVYTVGAWILNIGIPNILEYRKFSSSVFQWSQYKMVTILFSFLMVLTIGKPNFGLV